MTTLTRYDAARKALAEARRTDDVLSVRDAAERMSLYAKQAKDKSLEADATEIRLRAERRLGELITEQKRTVGLNRGTAGAGRPKLGGSKKVPPKDATPTLAEAGIDKKLSSRAQRLAALPEKRFEEVVTEARERVPQQSERMSSALAKPVTTERTKVTRPKWIVRDALDRIAVAIDREVDRADDDGRRTIGGYLRQRAHFLAPTKEKTA